MCKDTGFVNQGTVDNKQQRIRWIALGVSIFAHAAVLSVFGVVKFSQQSTNAQQGSAEISVSQAGQLTQIPVVFPKPKVVSESSSAEAIKENPLINSKPQISTPKQISNFNYQTVLSRDASPVPTALTNEKEPQKAQAEFFGSEAQGRRICYVVDCSGSMQGLWERVRAELINSIGRLEPDQYFAMIAFGAGSVQDSGGGKMVRASDRAKKEAYGFIDSLRPAGATNALDAIQKAVKMRDNAGAGPSVIYFLTDGFELGEQDPTQFVHRIMITQRSFAPKTQINTIGFWPDRQDRRTLERIAGESGGEFVIINDEDIPGKR